ncbi:MAG: hypothetical protein ABWZ40_11975 [Caulobacterales bacterium]
MGQGSVRIALESILVALSGRIGWIYAAIFALAMILLATLTVRSLPGPRILPTALLLIGGFALAGALLTPWALAESVRRSQTRMAVGPFKAAHASLALPSLDPAGGEDIRAEIWFPSASGSSAATAATETARTCLRNLPIAQTSTPRKLILYIPHLKSTRDDNTRLLGMLASYGYLVLALDDIANDNPPNESAHDAAVRLEDWNFTSGPAYERTIALSDERVQRQAKKALNALDRLASCVGADGSSSPAGAIDFDRVGVLGYSFGGSSVSEAATMDSRIVAVVNIDGSLFGEALSRGFSAPYMFIISDFTMPTREDLASPIPDVRYWAMINDRDIDMHAQLAARPGSVGVRVRKAIHENFRDDAFEPHLNKSWLRVDPVKVSEIVHTYVRGFFDRNLAHLPEAQIPDPERTEGVQGFRQIGMLPKGVRADETVQSVQ